MTYKAAAGFLRGVRESLGLSQEDLAPKIGVSPRQYIRIENGANRIKMESALLAIQLLDMPDRLFGRLWLDPLADLEIGLKQAKAWLESEEGRNYQLRRSEIRKRVDAAVAIKDLDTAIEDAKEFKEVIRRRRGRPARGGGSQGG